MGVMDKHNWTIEHIERMLDVAENPIGTQNYWMSAEKPWVFLSLCFEISIKLTLLYYQILMIILLIQKMIQLYYTKKCIIKKYNKN